MQTRLASHWRSYGEAPNLGIVTEDILARNRASQR